MMSRLWIRDPLAILAVDAERGVVIEGQEIVECVAMGREPVGLVDQLPDLSA